MKKSTLAFSIASLLVSSVALATSVPSADITVQSSTEQFASATGSHVFAENYGTTSGSAALYERGATARANYSSSNSGEAFGSGGADTDGGSSGNLEIVLNRAGLSAEALSQQGQSATTATPWGSTSATGNGAAAVLGSLRGANFSASGDSAESAHSGWYGWYGSGASVVDGGTFSQGSIQAQFGHHGHYSGAF